MATHPICDDPGPTDDRGSREGHLRSNEVTIRFSPRSRDMMEIETRKWFPNNLGRQTASEDMHIDLLDPWADLAWGHIMKLTFQGQKVHASNRLDEAITMVSFSFSYLI